LSDDWEVVEGWKEWAETALDPMTPKRELPAYKSLAAKIPLLVDEIARLREREAFLTEESVSQAKIANGAMAHAARLEEALRELERAATEYANENGVSGDLGARLYDARRALGSTDESALSGSHQPLVAAEDTDAARRALEEK
jgi:hypothetical protein